LVFPQSRIESIIRIRIRDTPSGDCDMVSFALHGQPFMAISAGSVFKFNPSVPFLVHFDPAHEADASARLDRTWAALSASSEALTAGCLSLQPALRLGAGPLWSVVAADSR
jgi:predicted 3-demethylubiquinone-9 3-methyltransferase (glyoxalase superfamily)